MRAFALWGVLLAAMTLPVPAVRAQPVSRQRVAVVRLDFDAGVVEAARELFAQRLVEGLAVAQFDVVTGAAVAEGLAAGGAGLGACHEPGCYPAVAAALKVAYLINGRVSAASKTYDVTLELINGRTGSSLGVNRERCEICGVEEAAEKMGLAASALRARLEALARTPARFIIHSRPPGASAALDGASIGRTPVDHELGAGPHKLTLTAPGYDVLQRTVTAVSGVDEQLDLELVPLPSRFPYRSAGLAGIITGALLIGGGIWAISVDGGEIACSSSQRDVFGHCPNIRDTRILGVALIGTGVASATLGSMWLYLGTLRAPSSAEASSSSPARRAGAALFAGGVF